MYTIKEAASRAAVSVQVLRAWERRYGVVQPARSESGYRLYDEVAIDRLRAMRRLIDDGWSPSSAAVHIRDLDPAEIEALLASFRGPGAGADDGASAEALRTSFVESAALLDETGLEQALDEMFARGSFEEVASELVMPALVDLGEGWAAGRLDVAAEHAAAGAVQRRLGMAFLAAGRPNAGRDVVLVGMPPGGRHELGAIAFATGLRRAGVGVRYLGADLPLQDWLDAVRRTHAKAAVIGVVIAADVEPAQRIAAALRAADPKTLIAFGGRAADDVDLSALQPAVRLRSSLIEAIDDLRAALP